MDPLKIKSGPPWRVQFWPLHCGKYVEAFISSWSWFDQQQLRVETWTIDIVALCVAGVAPMALGWLWQSEDPCHSVPPPEPAQCQKCHACHAKWGSMSPNATPATQSEGLCRQVSRLPRKVSVDVKLCEDKLCVCACHAKWRSMSPSATPAQSEGPCCQVPRLPRKSERRCQVVWGQVVCVYVDKFCVSKLCDDKLCELCESKLCVRRWTSSVWANCVRGSCVWVSCVWERSCVMTSCVSCVRASCVILAISIFTLRGRRGTLRHPPSFHVAGVVLGHNLSSHNLLTHNLLTHNLSSHNLSTHNLLTHNLSSHHLLTHNLSSHNLLTHNLLTQLAHTQLVITPLAHTQLVVTQLVVTQLTHTQLAHTNTYIHTSIHTYIRTYIHTSNTACPYTTYSHLLLFHTQLPPHQSFTISFLFPAFPMPSLPFFCCLLEEVDMWGYWVL